MGLMKKIATLVLGCALLTGCAGSKPVTPVTPPPINKDFSISLTWNYDFTNNFQCSATVTKGCVSGFTVGYMQGAAQVALPNNSVPLSACTGSTQPETCKYTGNSQLPIGQITWFATANGFDNNGTAVTATATSASPTTVSILSPTGVAGTAN